MAVATLESIQPGYGAGVLASRDEIKELLRARGLRATSSRVEVYAAVAALPGHPDVQEILAQVQTGGASISTQAVYDCLGSLTGAGLLRR